MIYRCVKYLLCISACGLMCLTALTTSAYAVEVGGQITGNFEGTINSQPFDDGVITGAWSWNTDTGEANISGTFSSVGISGDYTGAFDHVTQNIIGTWTLPGGSDAFPFELSLVPSGDLLVFRGNISGSAPSSAGPVDFTAPDATFEFHGSDEPWAEVSGPMAGTSWSGTFSGTTTSISTPSTWSGLGTGDWSATWTAQLSSTGQIVGAFDGTFSGTVEVDDFDPQGNITESFSAPCGGVFNGTLGLSEGQVVFTGAWQESIQTQGTTGSVDSDDVQQGYGGGIQFVLGSGSGGFPFPITGILSGGGVFPVIGSTVTYAMSGNFDGTVDLQ